PTLFERLHFGLTLPPILCLKKTIVQLCILLCQLIISLFARYNNYRKPLFYVFLEGGRYAFVPAHPVFSIRTSLVVTLVCLYLRNRELTRHQARLRGRSWAFSRVRTFGR